MIDHWAGKYIGKLWAPIGDGVDSFNCWTFVSEVQKQQFNRDMPTIDAEAASNFSVARACAIESAMDRWKRVDSPEDGDCVLLCRSTHPVHVGIWISANNTAGVLHCAQGLGVLFQTPASLRMSGWGKLSFYRWQNVE